MADVVGILVTVGEVAALWFLISCPVYLIARRTSESVPRLLGQSVGATVSGGAMYEVVILSATVLYGAIIGEDETSSELALVAAAIVWMVFYRSSLKTGWPIATVMTLVAAAVFLGINLVFGAVLGFSMPTLFQFPF